MRNRTQKVVINGHSSAPALVTSGVPQGTVTGPLWFLLYINDLPSNIISKSRMFADDCILYTPVSVEHNISILQRDLQSLELWQDTLMMNFNPNKCYTMTIGKRNPPKHPYKFCGRELDCVTSHPYLGVHIPNTLSWNTHIQEVVSKAQRNLNVVQ